MTHTPADYDPVASLYAKAFSDITVRWDECHWIENKLSKQAPAKLLDIGCVNGALLTHLAPMIKEGVGVDISSEAIKIATQNNASLHHLSFTTIDGPQLPFSNQSFDVIMSMLSFRYLDWDPILDEMTRVLTPEGRILIVDMVASKVKLHEWLHLSIDKLRNAWHLRNRKAFKENLHQLVTHPDWQEMLRHHPMYPQIEFVQHLKNRFPQGKMTVLNTGLRAKILAFESKPVK